MIHFSQPKKKKWKKKVPIEKVSVSKKEKLENQKTFAKILMVGQAVIEEGLDITEKDVDEQIAYTKEQKADEDLKQEIEELLEKELFKMVKEGKAEIIEEDHPSGALEDRSNSE